MKPGFIKRWYFVLKALVLAVICHWGQKRKWSWQPYVFHPIRIAFGLWKLRYFETKVEATQEARKFLLWDIRRFFGYRQEQNRSLPGLSEVLDWQTFCAALMHDVVEDCGKDYEYIYKHFGAGVMWLLMMMTHQREGKGSDQVHIDKLARMTDYRAVPMHHFLRTKWYLVEKRDWQDQVTLMTVRFMILKACDIYDNNPTLKANLGCNAYKRWVAEKKRLYCNLTVFEGAYTPSVLKQRFEGHTVC